MVRLAEGREAEVFLRADGSVLKLMRDPGAGSRIRREATAMRVLNEHGHGAPEVREIVEVAGRPALVTERIGGTDLLTVMGRHPWEVLRAGTVMATVHAQMHECEAPASLPDLNDELRVRIETAPDLPSDLAEEALSVLTGLPQGDRLCHGDFHLGNILGSWESPVVIDWGDASAGDPLADVARTELLHRIGDPPPGTSSLLRMLIPIGRGLLVRRYMATYRHLREIDAAILDRWKFVRAAARFCDGIEIEYEPLLAFLRARRHREPPATLV